MSRLGLEVGAESLRAVRIEKGTRRTFEVAWDLEAPDDAVRDVLATLGRAASVTIAVHGALHRVRRLDLPPLPLAERRRVLGLESDRYFATSEPLVLSVPGEGDLAFAMPESRLEVWLEAFRELGSVNRVEPAALALTRALSADGATDADVLRGSDEGVEWIRLEGGRLVSARHVFGSMESVMGDLGIPDGSGRVHVDPWPDGGLADIDEAGPLPVPEGLPTRFAAAYGAALASEEEWHDGFVTGRLEREHRRRRTRRTLGSAVAVAAALVFGVLSWDAYRDRVDARIDDRITELRTEAAPVLALEDDVETLQQTLAALDRIEASRSDVLGSLRALTNVVPADTWLRTIQVAGPDWQIQGVGSDAAALIPLLEQHPRFREVDFAAATRRVQTDNTTYDDFALAFRTTGPTEQP